MIKLNTDVFTHQLTDVRSADLGATPSVGIKPNPQSKKTKSVLTWPHTQVHTTLRLLKGQSSWSRGHECIIPQPRERQTQLELLSCWKRPSSTPISDSSRQIPVGQLLTNNVWFNLLRRQQAEPDASEWIRRRNRGDKTITLRWRHLLRNNH